MPRKDCRTLKKCWVVITWFGAGMKMVFPEKKAYPVWAQRMSDRIQGKAPGHLDTFQNILAVSDFEINGLEESPLAPILVIPAKLFPAKAGSGNEKSPKMLFVFP